MRIVTAKRKLIFDIVNNSHRHMTAEQIYTEAKFRINEIGGGSIAMATVYNSLNYLCDNGMIRKLKIRNYADCYDGVKFPHEHIICDRCGEVQDVVLEDLNEMLSEKLGREIISCELSIHHICDKCKK